MMPLLLFVYSDKEPSVNPAVFDYLYNVAAINKAAAEAKAAKEAAEAAKAAAEFRWECQTILYSTRLLGFISALAKIRPSITVTYIH